MLDNTRKFSFHSCCGNMKWLQVGIGIDLQAVNGQRSAKGHPCIQHWTVLWPLLVTDTGTCPWSAEQTLAAKSLWVSVVRLGQEASWSQVLWASWSSPPERRACVTKGEKRLWKTLTLLDQTSGFPHQRVPLQGSCPTQQLGFSRQLLTGCCIFLDLQNPRRHFADSAEK